MIAEAYIEALHASKLFGILAKIFKGESDRLKAVDLSGRKVISKPFGNFSDVRAYVKDNSYVFT